MKNKKNLLFLLIPIIPIVGSIFLLKSDFIFFIKIWFALFASGVAFFPLSNALFKKFSDRGWIFSKVLGYSIPALILYLLSYAKIAKFNLASVYIVFAFCFIANYTFLFFKSKKNKEKIIDDNVIKTIAIIECIFIIMLASWMFIKGLKPYMNNSTEQFMDYGFLNKILNTDYMPPKDIWFSGSHINYYYYGIYISAFIIKLAGLHINEGYNTIVSVISAYSFVMPLSIVYQLIVLFNKKKKLELKRYAVFAVLFAMLAGIGGCFGGSMHYPIYRYLAENKEKYYYPNETRYIGMDDGEDAGVTEKPSYSNVLGDLHAHYIAIMFSFTTMAVLLSYFTSDRNEELKKALISPHIIILGFLLGTLKMTNYWDLPIYIVIISIMIIARELICDKCSKKDVIRTILLLAEILIISTIITMPFSNDLMISMKQVNRAPISSPFYKLLVLWGLPAVCYISFFVMVLVCFIISKKNINDYLKENLSDFYIILLGACAFGLVLIPELVYVKDIYGASYLRYNTMFKLTYEAYIILSVCTLYEVYRLFVSKKVYLIILGTILLFLNITTYGYGFDTIYTLYKDNKFIGIEDSLAFIRQELPSDCKAIEWINNNIEEKQSIILEGISVESSYTTHSRISAFTGHPTVIGWTVHEWLWRTDKALGYPLFVRQRVDDVESIYNSNDKMIVNELIDKYNIEYIFIGVKEHEDYLDMDIDFLKTLGEAVYSDDSSETYLIKVR